MVETQTAEGVMEGGTEEKSVDTLVESIAKKYSDSSQEPNYLEMLNSYLPEGFEDKKDTLISGKSVPKDPDNNVAYLNIEKCNSIGDKEQKYIGDLLMEARLEDNIVAGWNPKTGKFKQAKDINDLSSMLIGKGKTIIGAAGPNVMQHGYKVLEYMIINPLNPDR